jgi:hypothetical protein
MGSNYKEISSHPQQKDTQSAVDYNYFYQILIVNSTLLILSQELYYL